MAYQPEFLDRLEKLGTCNWEGQVWRYTPATTHPARANTLGARWNPPGVAAVYTSLARATLMAEANYRLSLEQPRPRFVLMLHRIQVKLAHVLNLENSEELRRLGITTAELRGDDFTPCQYVGGAADFLECDGLLIPSARAPGNNLVIYPHNMENDGEFEVLESIKAS